MMERLDRLSSYFNEKEKKRLAAKTKDNLGGVPEMSFDEIRLSCLENNGYETPELNDKLYLHFRGFRRIENLDRYTGCKSIWLDSNGFDKIEGLDALVELRCLYLSKNLIHKIEGLSALQHLTILDLSYNRITQLDNLSCCPMLQTINLAYNSLSTVESIQHLSQCLSLTNIDLTNNRLESNEDFLVFFPTIPSLNTLSVNGNEITKISSFRKKMIAALPKLGYLDRPIDESERLFAVAFISGGQEAEAQARHQWKEQTNTKRIQEMKDFKEWQKQQQLLRQQSRQEGKSLIKEFTPEEQEQRRQEAEKAAKDEQDMIHLGIDKLAQKYWQLDASEKNHGRDILEMAKEQLREEQQHPPQEQQEQEEEQEVLDVSDVKIAVDQTSAVVEESSPMRRIPITEENDEEVDQEEVEKIEKPEEISEGSSPATKAAILEEPDTITGQQKSNKKAAEPTEEVLQELALKQEQERIAKAKQIQEEKEAAEREQRVADSFAIYKRQQQQQQQQQQATPAIGNGGGDDEDLPLPPPIRENQHHNTWHAAASSSSLAEEDDIPRVLYWSEVMDIELAKQVKANVFDFEAISACMKEAAKAKRLDHLIIHRHPELLTNEICRLRWAELDASNWCVPAPGITAQDTIFRINLSDEVLQQTGGAQPSFEELANIARSSKPSYLKVPVSFPCVQDMMEELD